uniref:(northern house mosquito) hypothetical protein n=1 Tax=Culex pipiens TaxID=7175 RepID=A0A8D8AU04_CULPI
MLAHTRWWFRNSENRTHCTLPAGLSTMRTCAYDDNTAGSTHLAGCRDFRTCTESFNTPGVGKNTLYENTDYSALPPRGRHYTGMAIFRWGVVVTHFRRKNTHGTHTKTVGIRRRQYGGCGTRQTHGGSSRFAKKNRDYVVGPRLRSVQ